MGSITISLSDESEKNLEKLAEKEKRSKTKQVEYILDRYIDEEYDGEIDG